MSMAVTCTSNVRSPPHASGRYTVVLVDDCQLSREGLRSILAKSRFNVVLAAANIHTVLTTQDRHAIDLFICSLDPQRIDTQLGTVGLLRRHDPDSKTVLLMRSCSADDLVAAVRLGIEGVILNDLSGDRLIGALELVMHDQHVLPLGVCRDIVWQLRASGEDERQRPCAGASDNPQVSSSRCGDGQSVTATAASDAAAAIPREHAKPVPRRNLGLSHRELQILQGLVDGWANKMIARRLNIAEATVKVHIKGLLRKLHVSNRTQAAVWAINNSLLSEIDLGEQAADDADARLSSAPDSALATVIAATEIQSFGGAMTGETSGSRQAG